MGVWGKALLRRDAVAVGADDAALDVMEFNSIRRYEIDWPAFREAARAEAEEAGAVAPSDTYPAIVAALERIGDNHSFFRAPGGTQLAMSSSAQSAPARVDPSTQLVAPRVTQNTLATQLVA